MLNMYKITCFAKQILLENVFNKNISVDFTLGNGNDTIFLSENFKQVHAFDVQEKCIENFKQRSLNNVNLILDGHENVDKYLSLFDCGMYNLGYLPEGDKSITTVKETTILSLTKSVNMLSSGGIITICVYIGHRYGQEEGNEVSSFCKNLDSKVFDVCSFNLLNKKSPPYLIVISKKR